MIHHPPNIFNTKNEYFLLIKLIFTYFMFIYSNFMHIILPYIIFMHLNYIIFITMDYVFLSLIYFLKAFRVHFAFSI